MNKKGFTLIELLAVLALLIIIFTLVFPSVKSVISTSEEIVYQKQINTILSAAYDWSLENLNSLPTDSNKTYITLGQLKNYGYIESNVEDPNTSEQFPEDYVISIKNVGSKYKNNDIYSKKNGDYLYKVEVELMNSSDYDKKRPSIILTDVEESNSEGNYLTTVNQNGTIKTPKITATSYNGNDITDKVVINIIYNGNLVETIDTSKIGIYYVNYIVIDSFGYSNTIIRNVVITDTEVPVITIPESTIISSNIKSYDLMQGVTCNDNSGKCDVIIENTEDVKFGVVGKYIVKYTATDSMGNTSNIERMITIE